MQFITEEEKRRKHIEVEKILTEKQFFEDMARIEEQIAKGECYTEEEFRQRMKDRSKVCK